MPHLPHRQLHLDFHNSPHIPDVGVDFDPDRFASELRRARVKSVTCFSRCHHGHLYHDSSRFPDLRHPNLDCDLLALQIEACHQAGIRAPIYITVGWDDIQRRRHPDWLELDEEGRTSGPGPLEPGFNHKLCLASPYADFVAQQTTEVLERFPCDGIFFDIVFQGPCLCRTCRERMEAGGLDPGEPGHRERNAADVLDSFKARMSSLVRDRANPGDPSIFYNAGHIGPETKRTLDQVTHLEIESLATGHWGYLHFPMTARYAAGMDLPLLGMTAAFHGSWGDFGAPKPEAALEYECMQMLSLGARCSVGDQLLPGGDLDRGTLDLIGRVFRKVEQREPWCKDARPEVEVGVLYPEAFGASDGLIDSSAAGALAVLSEGHLQFEFIDGSADLGRYRIILVPDRIRVGQELAHSLEAYVENGGALVLCHLGGLSPDGDRFTVEQVGAECRGVSPHEPDYLLAGEELAEGLPPGPLVMKWRAMRVDPAPGTEVLARVRLSHFDRTWRRFTSHQQAPPARDADYPAVIRNGRIIYFAHPLLSMYRQQAWPWCRDLLLNGLSLLLPNPLIRTNAPRCCQVTLHRQPVSGRERLVVHLTCYLPRQVGEELATLEEVLPLERVEVAVRCGSTPPQRVTLCPQKEGISFQFEAPYVRFTVPKVTGHQIISLD